MAVSLVVTDAGRAALVNAANTGTAPVTIAQTGISATSITPSPTATVLPGEIKRITTLPGDVVADDTIHLIVRDESDAVFILRSFALYLSDGTLFAIAGQAEAILEKSAQALMLLAIDVQFADIDANELTFGDTNFLNPPATTERQGVVELATVAEGQLGIDALRALTPSAAKAAILGWLLAQDGAGSGLDADLLDGQHGSWYTDITGRLGYTPLNAVAYTADDVVGKLVTVDGAGSGLDSDLLDGQHGSYYGNIPARLGFTPVQQGTGVGQLSNIVKIGWSGSRVKATVDASDMGNLVFDSHISDVWRASNDGSGSGLDADLLDGLHAASFARVDWVAEQAFSGSIKVPGFRSTGAGTIDGTLTAGAVRISGTSGQNGLSAGTGDGASFGVFNLAIDCWNGLGFRAHDGVVRGVYDARNGNWDIKGNYHVNGVPILRDIGNSLEQTGYMRLSNGWILQWGWSPALTNRAVNTVTFPLTFPNAALAMWATPGISIGLTDSAFTVGAVAISHSQGQIAIGSPTTGTIGCQWFVLGK